MKNTDVIVVGGGIIGLASAYYLMKEGRSVIVLDKGPPEDSCSHGNCGLISPSHSLPLNNPGLIIKSIKWLLQKDSPFFIRPQLNTKFMSWMAGFVFNANRKQVERSMWGRYHLLKSSRELYDQLFSTETLLNCNWTPTGILFAFKHPKSFEAYRHKNTILTELGLSAEPFTGEALRVKEPALTNQVYGGWFYDLDASLKPDELVNGLKKLLQQNSVQLITGCAVQNFDIKKRHITGVRTNKGRFTANHYVLATGVWTPLFENQLKLKIPIIPGKGYSITMGKPRICPKTPCIMQERRVVATPWRNTYRLGGTMEFSGYDSTLNQTRLDALTKAAKEYLKDPISSPVVEEWFGWRPMTNDGMPIIDQSPKHENLFLACGHNMLGLSMAPATGKLISEMILGLKPHIDQTPYKLR